MPFTPKAWQNYAAGGTPLSAAALIDLEQRLSGYTDATGGSSWLLPGALGETIGRDRVPAVQTLTSGTLLLSGGCVLRGGQAVTSITFLSGNVAGATLTNQWFCLVKQSDLSILRKTVDDTNAAWPANTAKTLNLSSTYIPANDTAIYLGCLTTATTPPNLRGGSSQSVVIGLAPIYCGTSTTGLTDPASLGATAGALSALQTVPFAYFS
jgi:hypothetical protein